MRKIYKILIVIFCAFLYVISVNNVVYAKNNNIDYESVSKELEKEIEKNHNFKNKENGDKITVKQLLNQNSGIGTYQNLGNIEITKNYGKYEYANANYNLLGRIIESVTNERYSKYVTKNIFKPLVIE